MSDPNADLAGAAQAHGIEPSPVMVDGANANFGGGSRGLNQEARRRVEANKLFGFMSYVSQIAFKR